VSSESINRAMASLQAGQRGHDPAHAVPFAEFLDLLRAHPERLIRNVHQVFHDMVRAYVGEGFDEYPEDPESINFIDIETFRVHDEWKVAGTADRIGIIHGRPMIMDIKTGSIDFPHAMAMQLAMYARSLPYDIATDKRGTDAEPVDLTRGVIIHLPAGQGRCDLYEIDIARGWGACLIAKQVWDWRGRKDLTTLIDPTEQPAGPATWESLILNADSVERLREIWRRAQELGQLTGEVRELAAAKSRELGA
jgi:hypothetical protein